MYSNTSCDFFFVNGKISCLDDDWNRGKLKDIRERQQEHHNQVSEELKAQEEEKQKKKNEELLKVSIFFIFNLFLW